MQYKDRQGMIKGEDSFQDRLLSRMYGCVAGRFLLGYLVKPSVSKWVGRLLDSRISSLFVPWFVRANHIDISMCEKKQFRSYNDFFTRKLKKGARKICEEKDAWISPCDGKLTVYPIGKDSRFRIKRTQYTVEQLLRNAKLAKRYQGGYAWIFRLSVEDYHRYCYVADGEKTRNIRIPGVFHTVNPIANDRYPIYKENTREYSLLHTEEFGTILMMEVGALLVGKIENHMEEGSVKKGEEKGNFAFGGSTIILLTEPGKVKPDYDILKNTQRCYETVVQMGEKIGQKNKDQMTSNCDWYL